MQTIYHIYVNIPFIVNFLYVYSFPIPYINLKRMLELKIISDIESAPRGFELIDDNKFNLILKEAKANEDFIVH